MKKSHADKKAELKKKKALQKKEVKKESAEKPAHVSVPNQAPRLDEPGAQDLNTDPLPTVIAESKAALALEAEKPLKRSRGRPRKDESARVEGTTAQAAPEQVHETPAQEQAFSFAPLISEGLVTTYAMRAKKTGFKEFELEREQADQLGLLADQCMAKYFPQMGEKMGLLSVTILTWGMVLGGRELAYIRHLNAQKPVEQVKAEQDAQDIKTVSERVDFTHADSFFGNTPNSLL